MQDVRYYSNKALAGVLLKWRKGNAVCSGRFELSADACYPAEIKASPINFRSTKERKSLRGIDKVVQTAVFDSYTFGLQWNSSPISPEGEFPRYYKETGSNRTAVAASEVPEQLRAKEFSPAKNDYSSPPSGAWASPGPAHGP